MRNESRFISEAGNCAGGGGGAAAPTTLIIFSSQGPPIYFDIDTYVK